MQLIGGVSKKSCFMSFEQTGVALLYWHMKMVILTDQHDRTCLKLVLYLSMNCLENMLVGCVFICIVEPEGFKILPHISEISYHQPEISEIFW